MDTTGWYFPLATMRSDVRVSAELIPDQTRMHHCMVTGRVDQMQKMAETLQQKIDSQIQRVIPVSVIVS